MCVCVGGWEERGRGNKRGEQEVITLDLDCWLHMEYRHSCAAGYRTRKCHLTLEL